MKAPSARLLISIMQVTIPWSVDILLSILLQVHDLSSIQAWVLLNAWRKSNLNTARKASDSRESCHLIQTKRICEFRSLSDPAGFRTATWRQTNPLAEHNCGTTGLTLHKVVELHYF